MENDFKDRSALDQAKQHLPEYLMSLGLDPSKNMPCLFHHPDNHPSMSLLPDQTAVYCHACGAQADLVNVIAHVEGLEPNSKNAINRAIEFAGTSPIKNTQAGTSKNASKTRKNAHWTPALQSHECVDYLHQRGFQTQDKDIIIKCKTAFDKKSNCLIIPHDGKYYTARAIGNVSKDARFVNNPSTSVTLFNGNAITTEPIIAVCEGAIDALSLICCGMPAVATGGAQTKTPFIKALRALKEKSGKVPGIIFAFDDDIAGNAAADKLRETVSNEFHSPFARLNLCGASDVNELFCKDRELLKKSIGDAVKEISNFGSAKAVKVLEPNKTPDSELIDPEKIVRQLTCNRFGSPCKIASNFDLIFDHDPNVNKLVAFDELSKRIILTRRPPWRRTLEPGTAWEDLDDDALQNYIDRTYDFRASSVFFSVLNEYALSHSFHPVQDFFHSLPAWDGKKRAESLLIDNLGADDSPYIRAITKQWLLAAVARIFHPGCKFDYCLVLKGKQGIGKSTLLQKLGGNWFGELDSIQGKDAIDKLQGLWIVELVEMQATKRADNEQIKAFLSTTKDRARLSYDRRTGEFPRQCIFAATTNEHDFLRDQTGGRRFWIAELHSEHYSIQPDFDPLQVWAETLHYYNTIFADRFDSYKLDLDNSLKPVATELQAKNTDGSDVRGRIEAFLERPVPRKELWQLLSQEERRMYYEKGFFKLPFARIEKHLPKHDLFDAWKSITKKVFDDELFLVLTPDIADKTNYSFIYKGDPRRHTITPVELANELFYSDKIAVSNRRIADILRTITGWQQSKHRFRDTAYGIQNTVFERVTQE